MGQSVEYPESGVVAIGQDVAIAHAVLDRHLADGAVEWGVDRGVGVVDTKPDDATDGVGEPVAALSNKREAGLYYFDAALVEIWFAFIFPLEWVETEW